MSLDNVDISEIREIALKINRFPGSSKHKEDVFLARYPEFFEKYKTLATMCCDGRVDESRLDFMLKTLAKVQKKETSQEKASEVIGQKLFDVYVKPKVPLMKSSEIKVSPSEKIELD